MDYKIQGGKRLSGSVTAESAKNSVLPIMAASVCAEGTTVIRRCPEISDVINMSEIINGCGVKSEFNRGNLEITPFGDGFNVSAEKSASVRTSVLMLGALSAKYGKAVVPYPGGCDLGKRPVDIHISALKDLGATVREENGLIICDSPVKGGKTCLPFPSVGATENAMIAASTCLGEAEIIGAAKEPEIADLADFINRMGGKVDGAGTSVIRVKGVKKLRGCEFLPSADRIEGGTYLIAGAITGGEIELKGVKAENISVLLCKLCDNTCKIIIKNDIIYLRSGKTRKGFSFSTGPYPLFPTDLQAPSCALCSVSGGTSVVKENVFTKRFHHIGELNKMGAKACVKNNAAIIKGVTRLHGAEVFAHDLRCGAAMVLAGLNAEGTTTVKDVHHVERGYYMFDKKLCALGAEIRRI